MDNEIKGTGNMINYKYRVHDARIGKFLSIDPLAPKYPHNSPYAFSENRVIDKVELEGLETSPYSIHSYKTKIQKMEAQLLDPSVPQDVKNEIIRQRKIGTGIGIGIVALPIAAGAALEAGGATFFYYGYKAYLLAASNSQALATSAGLFWGAFLDEDLPGPADNVARTTRRVGGEVVLDFFGGARSQIRGAINVDKKVGRVISDVYQDAEKSGVLGTVHKIFATNPQGDFLNEGYGLLREGGTITITGNWSNPHFRKIWKQIENGATEINGFKVSESFPGIVDGLKGKKFYQNDGVTDIAEESLKTIILKK